MPVPSPRNSIRVARGNYADLAANVTEIGEGELCFASDQDKFYSKSGGALVAVGGGTELYSIAQLGDVTLTSLSNGQFLQWDGAAWVNVNAAAPVDSVNGKIGTVVLALDDIDDVNLTTTPPNAGEVLGWNGSEWVPTENTGAGSTLNSTRYRYENSTDIDSVAAGKVRFNSTTFTLVTEIAFSNIDKNGVDIGAILQNMVDENYSVYFQQEDNAGKAVLFHFTGGCSNLGDNVRSKFPVEYISDSGSALSSGKDCYTILSAQATADSVTSVNGQQGAVVLSAADVGAATTAQGALADSAVQPGDLATVATSGSYNDLTNQPTIPAALPDLTDVANPLLMANGEVLRYRSSNSRFEPGVAVDPAGATMTGTLGTTERTITAGAFDLATGNHWTCGAITVPAPTNAAAGTSGLIRITAGPVVWNTVFKFPGGTAPTIASFPAIIPFYVQDSSNILMGNVAEGIA